MSTAAERLARSNSFSPMVFRSRCALMVLVYAGRAIFASSQAHAPRATLGFRAFRGCSVLSVMQKTSSV
jgi:hypothetical protein